MFETPYKLGLAASGSERPGEILALGPGALDPRLRVGQRVVGEHCTGALEPRATQGKQRETNPKMEGGGGRF